MSNDTPARIRTTLYRVGVAAALLSTVPAYGLMPSTLDLASADASFYGEGVEDDSGARVTGVGDVNGDGLDDVLIAAPGRNDLTGKVYLVFGRSLGLAPMTSLANADASFVGEAMGDQAGMSVAAAGDFNRDGYADIAIAAPTQSAKGFGTGKVYLIYGKPTGWSKDMPLAQADASFVGEASMALAGMSISAAGDVNRDGYPDLAVGAPGQSSSAGKLYIVLGASSANFKPEMELSSFPSYTGEAANNFAGFSVAGIGDFNGDGYSEVLVGAYGNSQKASQAGKSYLIYGHAGSWSKNAPLVQVTSFFLGQASRDYAGYAVAAAGDIDRDGFADFLIGAPGRDKNGDASGLVAVMYGRSGTVGAYDLGQVDAAIPGETAGDQAGSALAGGIDLDGDGFRELLVSAHFSDRGDVDAGAAYLMSGSKTRLSSSSALSGALSVLVGESALDQAAYSLASAGDVDGDGFDDLLVSAHGSDVNGAASGLTYLVLAGPRIDMDGDGYSVAMGDCNDYSSSQNPGAKEIPRNGIDEDCNGADAKNRTARQY